jgi:hypothetical protein
VKGGGDEDEVGIAERRLAIEVKTGSVMLAIDHELPMVGSDPAPDKANRGGHAVAAFLAL